MRRQSGGEDHGRLFALPPPGRQHWAHLACHASAGGLRGVCECVCGVGGVYGREDSRKTSPSPSTANPLPCFSMNHSYREMLTHVHKTPQLLRRLATLCYLHVFARAAVSASSTHSPGERGRGRAKGGGRAGGGPAQNRSSVPRPQCHSPNVRRA